MQALERVGNRLKCPQCGYSIQTTAASGFHECGTAKPPQPRRLATENICDHRGEILDTAACKPCRNAGRYAATIYSCSHFGRVTDGTVIENGKHLHHCGAACERYNLGVD